MRDDKAAAADSTAVRVALWRAMHVQVDRPGPSAWKHQRLIDRRFGVPDWLRLVPVDFEAGESFLVASC